MATSSSPGLCRLHCCSFLCLSRSHYLGFDSIDIKKSRIFCVYLPHSPKFFCCVCYGGFAHCAKPCPLECIQNSTTT